jgi:hypothetical protein
MRKIKYAMACFVIVLMTVPPVFAQDPIIYPNKGQSAEQQEKVTPCRPRLLHHLLQRRKLNKAG